MAEISDNKKLAALLSGTPLVPPMQTKLPPHLEGMYQSWVNNNNIPVSNDYDMRGYYYDLLSGNKDAQTAINASDGQPHFTDKWKLPNHPSFSNESIYSKSSQDPKWVGNYVDDKGAKHWNLPPYNMDTWALQNKQGNKLLEIPQ